MEYASCVKDVARSEYIEKGEKCNTWGQAFQSLRTGRLE